MSVRTNVLDIIDKNEAGKPMPHSCRCMTYHRTGNIVDAAYEEEILAGRECKQLRGFMEVSRG